MQSAVKAAVFLDRDGVINYNRADYVKSWAEFRFLPGALTALKRLASSPLDIIVVTNQSAVGRGLLNEHELKQIHANMIQTIQAKGGRIDHVFYCPHHPNDGCLCRKPKPGMLIQAASALNIDLAGSYLVGDALSDIQAGLAAGCFPLLAMTGRGAAAKEDVTSYGDGECRIVQDLSAAVDWILRQV